MEKIELKADPRTAASPEHIRAEGFIPAVVYGHNIKTESFMVRYADFEKAFKKAGESTLVNLVVDGKAKNVIVQDVQRHYLTGKYQHVDFYEVSMTEKMKAKVPLVFVGVSKAVKENGGVFVAVMDEVEVECLPADLIHNIEVDISVLQTFADNIHVRDLKVGDKVKILSGEDETVAKVEAPRDVEKELATPVVEDISKVEGAAETPKEPTAEGEKKENKAE